MYRFDSRFLTQFDTVTKQFSKPGTYYYFMAMHPELSKAPTFDEMAIINVSEESSTAKPKQHRIRVQQHFGETGFSADPENINLHMDDTIQWHKPKAGNQGYFVQVFDDNGYTVFNSQRLVKHDVFTHMFTHPGDYQYHNSLNPNSQRPAIRVYQVDPREQNWKELSQKPILVRYVDNRFMPEQVDVPEGGTVVWFIEDNQPLAIQLTCYELKEMDLDKIPRSPRGKRGCEDDDSDDGCGKSKRHSKRQQGKPAIKRLR